VIRLAEPTFLGREAEYVTEALRIKSLSMGKYVLQFESFLRSLASSQHAVAVSSGTAALHTSLLALGVKPADRVVVPACSYIATANAVRYCGAVPIFADVNPHTWTLDLEQAEEAVREFDAVGIVTVNLYGVPCGRPFIPGVWVLEDACESHGVPIGGDISVLSFYGNKIITTGEGGAVLTNSDELAAKVRLLRGQGTSGAQRYIHETLGFNYRMTDLQAALGCGQIELIHDALRRRRQLADVYRARLGSSVRLQARPAGSVDWVMPVCVEDAPRVAAELETYGIETRPIFPALHTQPIYRREQSLPVAEELAKTGLVLPLHLGMTLLDVQYVVRSLLRVLEEVVA
jgi:perosamine synthetase